MSVRLVLYISSSICLPVHNSPSACRRFNFLLAFIWWCSTLTWTHIWCCTSRTFMWSKCRYTVYPTTVNHVHNMLASVMQVRECGIITGALTYRGAAVIFTGAPRFKLDQWMIFFLLICLFSLFFWLQWTSFVCVTWVGFAVSFSLGVSFAAKRDRSIVSRWQLNQMTWQLCSDVTLLLYHPSPPHLPSLHDEVNDDEQCVSRDKLYSGATYSKRP